jgi:glutamate racemase
VLGAIISLLPRENTIYLGDTARVPYGIRSAEVVTRYSFESTKFLLSRGIKLLVIACNTVSALSITALRERTPVPVIGVIEPGARAAAEASASGRIGVIGTEATVRSGAYQKTINSIDPGARVFSQACPLFVPLVEDGWVDNDVALLVAARYLKPLMEKDIDTLVLGCTHYPLLKGVIRKVVGKGVKLIDSATETAREIEGALSRCGIENGARAKVFGCREFYVTDFPQKFESLAGRLLGPCAAHIKDVKLMEVWDETRWKKK